jgi:hypothetical protein
MLFKRDEYLNLHICLIIFSSVHSELVVTNTNLIKFAIIRLLSNTTLGLIIISIPGHTFYHMDSSH